MMRRILVAGGAGFIGSNFIRYVLRERGDVSVVNFDALTYAGNPENLLDVADDDRYAFVHGSVADAAVVAEAMRGCDAVVNFAAETHVDRSIDGPAAFVQANMVGTFTLLHEALHHWKTLDAQRRTTFRFVHVSTDEVFGALGAAGKFTEQSPYDPRSPYAASKAGLIGFTKSNMMGIA